MLPFDEIRVNWPLWTWALLGSVGLCLSPSTSVCLGTVAALFLVQLYKPMPWQGFKWFVLLWVGVWSNCFWDHDLFAFDALRFPALTWVMAIGFLPSLQRKAMLLRFIDVGILFVLFTVNHMVSWSSAVSMQRNLAIAVVAIGLVAAGRATPLNDFKVALMSLWFVLVLQLAVSWIVVPEVAWVRNDSIRFQGFSSNPNSISHPFLILGMSVMSMIGADHRRFFLTWTISAFIVGLTGSRTAMLAFATFSALILSTEMILPKSFRLRAFKATVLAAFALGLAECTGWKWMRLESLMIGGGRFNAWPTAVEHMLEAPWLGRGAGYENQWFFSMEDYFRWLNHIGNSHNAFLGLFMDYGIAGGSLLFAWMAWRFGWFNGKRRLWTLGLPLLVEIFFENWLLAPLSSSFLLMAAASMAACAESETEHLQST